MRGASSWQLPFVLLSLKQPHRLLAAFRAFARTVWAALAGRATVRTTTDNAPGIVLSSGGVLYYVWSVSSPDHSETTVCNMTNLNQIDKDLKALGVLVDSLRLAIFGQSERISALSSNIAILSGVLKSVESKIEDMAGGPAEDDQQNEVDAAAAKINADADSLTDAING